MLYIGRQRLMDTRHIQSGQLQKKQNPCADDVRWVAVRLRRFAYRWR